MFKLNVTFNAYSCYIKLHLMKETQTSICFVYT